MKKEIVLLLLLFALFITPTSYAQQQLKLAGNTYNIPEFSMDSVASFNDVYVQTHILHSIKSSPYDLEIRVIIPHDYLNFGERGYCMIIRSNKDSLFAKSYTLRLREGIRDEQAEMIKKDLRAADFDLMLIKHNTYTSSQIDSALKGLLLNRVTNLPSNKKMIANLKERGIKIVDSSQNDCCLDILYEVKVGNRFRNFNTNAYYYQGNEKIKEISNSENLDDIIYKLNTDLLRNDKKN